MYDESEDFRVHKFEIDSLVDILRGIGMCISRDMTVLDLGGGQGMHVGYLCALADRVFCADIVDYSSLYNGEFLKLIDEKHRRNNVEFHLDRVAFHRTDAMDLIYRDALFDCVVSINSFEHIPNPGKALREMIRVTRPGGYVYIATDPIWTADSGSHFIHRVPEPWAHLLSDDGQFIAKMLAAGASQQEAEEYRHAMNRWRAKDYASAIRDFERDRFVDVLYHDAWSGVTDESHRNHANLRHLARLGFEESELMVRGLRWVLQIR